MSDISKIRNFAIIAHIDHGKSTLADRMLELTGALSPEQMEDRVLDTMELEKERGITIKMQPVRMNWKGYEFNLIDTPGHIDFKYEVSRALGATEGVILLVDAVKGVQAQTLAVLDIAKKQGLVVIPVITKIDMPAARVGDVVLEIMEILDCDEEDILRVSGKTGEGVEVLLDEIIKRVPAPEIKFSDGKMRLLVFDYKYSKHTGITVFMRVMSGSVRAGDTVKFIASNTSFSVAEVGVLTPDEVSVEVLNEGQIGYIVTGIKKTIGAVVGDTITMANDNVGALPGYEKPRPVVWASVYPENQADFDALRLALARLNLSDSSFTYEEETSGVLGRGFRIGFLGMLHLEIISERLKREFDIQLVITSPSVHYIVRLKNGEEVKVFSPHMFPDHGEVREVLEQFVKVDIITPSDYLDGLMQLIFEYEGDLVDTENFGDGRLKLEVEMPLRELMRNFFDKVKAVSSGYASISYEQLDFRPSDLVRIDVYIAGELYPSFMRVTSRQKAERVCKNLVSSLHELLPRQLFEVKVQAGYNGRIFASKTIKAFRKDVTAKLYGGDRTRRMKLLEKQKKGKKKMAKRGRMNIDPSVFIKILNTD